MLSLRERLGLRLQAAIARCLALPTYYLTVLWFRRFRGYRVPEMRRIREAFREIRSQGGGPFIICANHLTMIDSLLGIWVLAPGWRYLFDLGCYPWNVPERRHVRASLFFRVGCYIGKCVTLLREGPQEGKRKVMQKLKYLMSRGQSLMIFPEGGRSRTGRVDAEEFSYGVGQILLDTPAARVLCLYLRGKGQEQYSNLPRRGEEFYVDLKLISPASKSSGLRAVRDLATQIIGQLKAMELEYFGMVDARR